MARRGLMAESPEQDSYQKIKKLFDEKKFDEIIRYCQKLLVEDSKNKVALQNISTAYNIVGGYQDAIETADKMLKIDRTDEFALKNKMFAYEQLQNNDEVFETNIVKVEVDEELKNDNFIDAKDFFRIKKKVNNEKIYHHIGIYAFTNVTLKKYVSFARSKLEIERNLEQMRAMENNIKIKVGLSESTPLGVDTEEDLKKITQEMKKS